MKGDIEKITDMSDLKVFRAKIQTNTETILGLKTSFLKKKTVAKQG